MKAMPFGRFSPEAMHLHLALAVLLDDRSGPCPAGGCRRTPCPCRRLPQRARVGHAGRHRRSILKPFGSFSLPGRSRAFRPRPASAAARPARASSRLRCSGGRSAASRAAMALRRHRPPARAGGCCATAGHARSVAKVVASRSARRVEYPLVMWSSLTRSRRSLRWFTADACGAAPSHPVSDFCNRSAIALRPPHWHRAVLCDKARAKSRKHAAT